MSVAFEHLILLLSFSQPVFSPNIGPVLCLAGNSQGLIDKTKTKTLGLILFPKYYERMI